MQELRWFAVIDRAHYERWLLELQVQGVTWKISVGLEEDILYPMILVRDWPEIYDVIASLCPSKGVEDGLLGVSTGIEEELDLAGLANSSQF